MTSRKALIIAASTTTYLAGVYLTYHYNQKGSTSENGNEKNIGSQPSFSYIQDPNRTQTFSKIAKTYDEQISFDENILFIPLLRRWLLHFHAKGKVLEVGAGTCRNLKYYPKVATSITLTDASDTMCLEARKKLLSLAEPERQRFRLAKVDALNLNFLYPDDSFDTVVDTFGLCSFDDPVAALREMSRVCNKNGGKILLLEHGRSKTFSFITKHLDEHADCHAKKWGCVWNRDIDDMLQRAGLEIEAMYTWHFGTTYYIVCRPVQTAMTEVQ